MDFDRAFDKVIGHEGGYVNDPRDPGGETKYGISRRAYPNLDIRNLTLDQAKGIYKRDYWDRCLCDQLPGLLRFHIFDAAVNSGVKQAAIWLQRAVGANADGIVGPRTIAAARAANPERVVAHMTGQRLDFMADLKNWPVHGRGWAKRLASNLTGL